MVGTSGRHLVVDYWGCEAAVLADLAGIEATMRAAADAAGAHVVGSVFHRFSPTGVSGVLVIAESHLSIHTWPDEGYAACDFYTCGDCRPMRAHEVLVAALGSTRSEVVQMERGGRMRKTVRKVRVPVVAQEAA